MEYANFGSRFSKVQYSTQNQSLLSIKTEENQNFMIGVDFWHVHSTYMKLAVGTSDVSFERYDFPVLPLPFTNKKLDFNAVDTENSAVNHFQVRGYC